MATDPFKALDPRQRLDEIGINPNSPTGASVLAARAKMAWLERGYDVPIEIELTVPRRGRGSTYYGPKAILARARRVQPEEVPQLKTQLVNRLIEELWA